MIASQYGKVYTWEIKVQLMGMKGHMAAQHIIDSLQLPLTVDEYLAKIIEQYNSIFPNAKALPGTVERFHLRTFSNAVMCTAIGTAYFITIYIIFFMI